MTHAPIHDPADTALLELCQWLAQRASNTDQTGQWPAEQLAACGEARVFDWFVPARLGGAGWSEADLLRGYLKLSAACLTTTFILTQWVAACRRILDGDHPLAQQLAPGLRDGSCLVTVGISHLTTSRRHLKQPPLTACAVADGYQLDGYSPWVTGGAHADGVVTGAVLADGQQVLLYVETNQPGVRHAAPESLVALSASHTGAVRFESVMVPRDAVLAGPVENVLAHVAGSKTGGLQTSTLALGLARAAIDFLLEQSTRRPDLETAARGLDLEQQTLVADLLQLAEGRARCTSDELRARSNSMALRATQAALAAAKGAGYVNTHPAGRWCREALFFLVWSCPQPVMNANLCELAGLD